MNGSSQTAVLAMDQELRALKDAHELLYGKASRKEARGSVGKEERHQLLKDVESLLDRMHQLAEQVTDVDQFNWLSEAATQWQRVYADVFNIPEDVREKVGVVSSPRKLTPVPPPISEAQIDNYLQRTAGEISQSRKLTALYEQFEYLRHHRSVIHGVIHSSYDEMQRDWYDASVYLASDALAGKALDGRVDFARDFQPSMFPYLERVWLDDVKRLRAYRSWYQATRCWDEHPESYYLDACDELRKLVLDESIKSPATALSGARGYIETRYLVRGRIRPDRNRAAKQLIAIKACRLWELRREAQGPEDNWREAEQYVKQYYENVLTAVADRCTTATRLVARAVGSHHALVSAFEAAVYVFLVRPEAIRTSCIDLWRLI